jgi:hypothetical protein
VALTAIDQGDGLSSHILKSMKNYLHVTNTEITKTNTTLRRWMESRGYEIPSFFNSPLTSMYRTNCDGNLFQPLEMSSTVDRYAHLAARYVLFVIRTIDHPAYSELYHQERVEILHHSTNLKNMVLRLSVVTLSACDITREELTWSKIRSMNS